MKVYGINEINKNPLKEFKQYAKDKNSPEKWKWTPNNPEKIRNISSILQKEREEVNYSCITNYEPTNSKQNIILIFAMGNLSYGFLKAMEKYNTKYVFIDFSQFVLKGKITTFFIENQKKSNLEIEDVRVDLNDVKVVIWNTPFYPFPLFDHDVLPKRNKNRFLHRKRWAQIIKEFKGFLNENVIWLPGDPFEGSQEWQNKITEYNIAHEEGFSIPPYILTNSKKDLLDFINNNSIEDILFREFSTPPYSYAPIKIKPHNINSELLKTSPCFFQKYIEKKHEYRVIVVMDKVFPCKIYSQESNLTKYDWRVHDDSKVKWELVHLPNDISHKLINLCKRLNLTWCSIDLIYSTDNNYYYLEANRPGAHYWLDMFIGLDITEEIIKVLCETKILT